MSSSVFIEPSAQLPEEGQAADANLVVVYGKTGVNIDPSDLERLIEEKTVQSISVIRLTSPSPSMEDAEECERLEGERNLEDSAADTDELTDAETNESKRFDAAESNETSNTESEADDSDGPSEKRSQDDDQSDHEASLLKKRNRGRKAKKRHGKSKTNAPTHDKTRAELVGLTFEGFYEAQAALEIAKEACKMAGIPFVRNTAEHEALLLVIKNDHCYTPFTSPEQMKAKLAADKLEAEEIATNARKLQPQLTAQAKQVMLMKARKPQLAAYSPVAKTVLKKPLEQMKERRPALEKMPERGVDVSAINSADDIDEEEETYELIDIETDESASEQSGESDNDRDSDLDFNVTKRQLKKRKVPFGQRKSRKLIATKVMLEKRQEEQTVSTNAISPATSSLTQRSAAMSKSRPVTAQRQGRTIQKIAMDFTQKTTTSNTATAQSGVPKIGNKVFARPGITISPKIQRLTQTTLITTPSHTPATPTESLKRVGNVKGDAGLLSPKQNVKEIVLNKVIARPTGGFTELSTLISAGEIPQKLPEKNATKPVVSIIQNVKSNESIVDGAAKTSRGFLRIDAASKNLPAQISIETHPSSNELAAEHDKQLDLIDSIVKDELNKSLEQEIDEKPSIGINENIPKLVEMLESTEKALVSNTATTTVTSVQATNLNTASVLHPANVDDIDISHGLPEDLLQHVVELIEDDKTLKEAVEKQILEEQSFGNDNVAASNQTGFETLSAHPQIHQPMQLESTQSPTPVKSIIQMSISNVNSPLSAQSSSPSNTAKASPLVRRDPIKIVRGNGRVITLPPIEAPTTRAKRRAQATPSSVGQQPQSQYISEQTNPMFLNESSLDSSVHSNASLNASSITAAMHATNTQLIDESMNESKQNESFVKRQQSKESKSSKTAAVSRTNTKKSSTTEILQPDDAEESLSQGDDDDPNKLWCICRQPHNNRFMICCDVCADWFHGKCVNITKAMGREMEKKGKEWTCPLCKKKQEDKQQRKLTDMLQVKRSNSPNQPKSQMGMNITSTATVDGSSQAFVVSAETGLTKKFGADHLDVMQTPTSSKKSLVSPVVNKLEGQSKLLTGKFVGQGKVKQFAVTPVRSPNAQIKALSTPRPDSSLSQKATQAVAAVKNANVSTAACVICKKIARPSTVYCSDDCIRRCAQNAINAFTSKNSEQITTASSSANAADEKKKKQKGLFEDLLSMPDRKPKIERITVYERKSGTKLSGSNAPTTLTIKKWLHDNPTYEIVLPGSQLSLEIEQKLHQQQQKATENAGRTPVYATIEKINKFSPMATSNQPASKTINSPTIKTPIKHIGEEHKQQSSAQRSATPKQLQKYPQQVHLKSAKEEAKPRERQQLKRQLSESSTGSGSAKRKSADSASTSSPMSSTDSEVRMNVRRTLKHEILQRMRESAGSESSRLTTEEIEAFVKQTESEMYNYFNHDTGQKYRNKYRSLMFNIKDRKNRTLFAKICAKQIEPKQLVHMSGAELASQELAKWREEENKHQLEMIKKSELEMLSCTKNYLFKNHKGEEVLESKESDVCVNLDITTPVEDLVNALNSSREGASFIENESIKASSSVIEDNSHKQFESSLDNEPDNEPEHHQHSHHHHHHEHHHQQQQVEAKVKSRRDSEKQHRSKSREHDKYKHDSEKDRDRDRRDRRHRSRSRERQHERHHRDKSRSRRRSASRSKSRSRSQEKRHKSFTSHHKDERRERERDRDRDSKDRKKTGTEQKKAAISTTAPTKTSHVVAQLQQKDKHRHSPVQSKPKQTSLNCFNLIDQIIESSKTVEEAANLVKDTNKEKSQANAKLESKTAPSSSTSHEAAAAAAPTVAAKRATSTSDSDQEPTSTVSIPTPPHELASFSRTNSPTTESESATLWSGPISMNEVATLQINIQPLIGNSRYIGNILPEALDVVGRIDNETVWEYLWKIRKSPNKEIVLICLSPLCDDDIDGYAKLFTYLDQKKRLGVVKSITPRIKDIYIYPLGSGRQLPKVLQVVNEHEFYDDPYRSDIIVGILVCVIGKRSAVNIPSTSTPQVSSSAHFGAGSSSKLARRHRTDATESITPPGSPKRKKRTHKTDIDLDAIIKAPIVRKPAATTSTPLGDDADEPYSPGGSSDDDLVSMYTAKAPPTVLLGLASADEDLKRKMEEINRQIAAQEKEIAGLLNAETTGASASALANISIPSNLPQILASINKGKEALSGTSMRARSMDGNQANKLTQQMSTSGFEEYNPEDAILPSKSSVYTTNSASPVAVTASTSRLAQLSEAELLSMVPDDVLMEPATKPPTLSSYYKEPPPPGV